MKFVGNVHIGAGREEDMPRVLEMLRQEGIATHKNPDLDVRVFGAFGIDEARSLSERASSKAISHRRVFVVVADSMSSEAQNALLKTLEEPAGNALFIFLVPTIMQLLPTLRSRAQILSLPRSHAAPQDAAAFLSASPAKRLELLKPLLEKSDEDRRDIGAIIEFLASLEQALAVRSREKGVQESMKAIYRARRYLSDRGALVKPLLEQVALLI
jgi:DNA polymerase III delta prime subunit